jgi:hypothetical protein
VLKSADPLRPRQRERVSQKPTEKASRRGSNLHYRVHRKPAGAEAAEGFRAGGASPREYTARPKRENDREALRRGFWFLRAVFAGGLALSPEIGENSLSHP